MAETVEQLCQHIDAQRAWIKRDLEVAARKATRCREGSKTYMAAVADIARLRKELDDHKRAVRMSGTKCHYCLERGD